MSYLVSIYWVKPKTLLPLLTCQWVTLIYQGVSYKSSSYKKSQEAINSYFILLYTVSTQKKKPFPTPFCYFPVPPFSLSTTANLCYQTFLFDFFFPCIPHILSVCFFPLLHITTHQLPSALAAVKQLPVSSLVNLLPLLVAVDIVSSKLPSQSPSPSGSF